MYIKGQIEANKSNISYRNHLLEKYIIQRIFQHSYTSNATFFIYNIFFNAVYTTRPNISFQTLTYKTVKTISGRFRQF